MLLLVPSIIITSIAIITASVAVATRSPSPACSFNHCPVQEPKSDPGS